MWHLYFVLDLLDFKLYVVAAYMAATSADGPVVSQSADAAGFTKVICLEMRHECMCNGA